MIFDLYWTDSANEVNFYSFIKRKADQKCGCEFLRCKLYTVYLLVLVMIITVIGHQLVHQSVKYKNSGLTN